MDARTGIEDKWVQLLAALGVAEQFRLCSDDDGRGAAILQLRAILDFLDQTAARCPTSPLWILLNALRDLEGGAKPAKILTPRKSKNRPRHDVVLRAVKVVAAVTMDQLHEYAGMSRTDAAQEVAKVFDAYGLSKFRGRERDISASTIEDWRDQAREALDTSELGHAYRRIRSIDAKALAQDAPSENKRDFLLKRRLPAFLTPLGAQGPRASKTRQRLVSDINRRIPKKPGS